MFVILKSDSHLPKFFFICFNESPLKMMKNAFFILKALFVLKIIKFLSRRFGHDVLVKNGLIMNIRLISKLIASQPG